MFLRAIHTLWRMTAREEDRVWQQKKRAERGVMAGFKYCNGEVITHSELTLQMDELLECALPRLRVRKLHMHKTKMGEGGTSYRMKSEKQPDTSGHFSVFSVAFSLSSHFNAMGNQSSETQD